MGNQIKLYLLLRNLTERFSFVSPSGELRLESDDCMLCDTVHTDVRLHQFGHVRNFKP